MKMGVQLPARLVWCSMVFFAVAAADDPKALFGTWSGRASGPEGGPPTGEIEITIDMGPVNVPVGKITVKGPDGGSYSGSLEKILLEKNVLTATAVFKLGESALEAQVSGPLKSGTIKGTFTVASRGEVIGEGTFSIARAKPSARR